MNRLFLLLAAILIAYALTAHRFNVMTWIAMGLLAAALGLAAMDRKAAAAKVPVSFQ